MPSHVTTGAAHHLGLTVTDPARSRQFYTELLGFNVLMELPNGVLIENGALLLGLRTAPDADRATAGEQFDPNHVGLDHLALAVASRADLEAAARLFDEHGVSHGEIVDLGPDFRLYVLMLEDPDKIQIELSAPYA